jgi:hypothetical protein
MELSEYGTWLLEARSSPSSADLLKNSFVRACIRTFMGISKIPDPWDLSLVVSYLRYA